MGKIEVSAAAVSSLQLTEDIPHMDAASKEILANKEFLAIILKHTAKEYEDLTYQEIVDCIEADKIDRSAEVAPGRTNRSRVEGINPEFKVLNEMMSQFDIYFKAVNPKMSNGEVACYIYFDVEAQNNYRPGYPIETRGIYYLARMISSQIAAPTATTNYGLLSKVYSIFICRDNIPKSLQNSISRYEMTNTWNNREMDLDTRSHDLMTMVVLRLGDPADDEAETIIKVLNALFCPRNAKSYEVLEQHITFGESLKREVDGMTGLGATIFREGKTEGKAEVARNMHQDGFAVDEIARLLRVTVAEVETMLGMDDF